jgi:hypothetical protein
MRMVRAYDVGTTLTRRRRPATIRVTGLVGISLVERITRLLMGANRFELGDGACRGKFETE